MVRLKKKDTKYTRAQLTASDLLKSRKVHIIYIIIPTGVLYFSPTAGQKGESIPEYTAYYIPYIAPHHTYTLQPSKGCS
jgi:hypothetical protein